MSGDPKGGPSPRWAGTRRDRTRRAEEVVGRPRSLEKPRRPRGPKVVVLALVAVLALTIVAVVITWSRLSDLSLQWAAVSAIATLGTLLLAVIAGTVAAIAYSQSVRRPYLVAEVYSRQTDGLRVKEPALNLALASQTTAPTGHALPAGARMLISKDVSIVLTNTGSASARNIRLRLGLWGILWFPEAPFPDGWAKRSTDPSPFGATTQLVWEGGADYSIHADGDTRIWDFRLGAAYLNPNDPNSPTLTLQVVADSCPERMMKVAIVVGDAR